MTERFKLSLSGIWLLVSIFALILPIFLPSASDSSNLAANVIGSATTTMFILSFPSSLFGIPFLLIVGYAIGVDPNSIQGMYLNLFLLFVVGLVQWFWIVPRVWQRTSDLQVLNLPTTMEKLPESRWECEPDFFASTDKTPLERVFSEQDEY